MVVMVDARAGAWPYRPPPGPDFTRALVYFTKTGEKLFSSAARCAEDVLRKYGLLEEFSYRSFNVSKFGFGSNRDAHWYAQLDADMERFGVNINPWWRDGYPSDLMIDGCEVEWRDGRFVPVEI